MKKLIIFTITLLISQTASCMDIFEAIKQDNFDRVQELIAENPEIVNAPTNNNHLFTPLQLAIIYGHENVIHLLLDFGANVNAQSYDGGNSLHCAAKDSHENIMRLLLDRGANVNAQDYGFKSTPLHFAAKDRHENVTRLLLDRGGNVNAQDRWKRTPLYRAAENGHVNIVHLLLNRGGNLVNVQHLQRMNIGSCICISKVVQLLNDWPYYQNYQIIEQRERIRTYYLALQQLSLDTQQNIWLRIGQLACPEFFRARPDVTIFEDAGFSNHTIEEIHQMAEQERAQEQRRQHQNNSWCSIQ